jgi:hypothetical protein
VLTGHLSPAGFQPVPWSARLSSACEKLATALTGAVACWLAFRTLEDGDWQWAVRRLSSEESDAGDEPYLDDPA